MTLRVLFVCLGNICRSPTAEGVFTSLVNTNAVFSDSAGTGAWHVGEPPDKRSQAAAKRQGVDLSGQRARQVTKQDFHDFDHILAMDSSNLAALERMQPAGARAKLGLLLDHHPDSKLKDVPDPYFEDGFDTVFQLVKRACEGLAKDLKV